jgi:O-6-methylguanine DNA methyltransferase
MNGLQEHAGKDRAQTEHAEPLLGKILDPPLDRGAIARRLGDAALARAAGAANGANPIAIVVPCPRVIGSNGKLVSYAGGLETKAAPLDFEAAVINPGPRPFSQAVEQLSLITSP